jgi:hypothetical protein
MVVGMTTTHAVTCPRRCEVCPASAHPCTCRFGDDFDGYGVALHSTVTRTVLCDWCDETATHLVSDEGHSDRACWVHVIRWAPTYGDGATLTVIGDLS